MGATVPRLIGLYSSCPQSGKSEVANYLTTRGFRRVKFARPVKQMIYVLLREMGLTHFDAHQHVEGTLKDELIPGFNRTARFLMETLGTGWGRNTVQSDLWIKSSLSLIKGLITSGRSVVVDDMRFPNEYLALKRLGGVVVRVVNESPPESDATSNAEGLLDTYAFDHTFTAPPGGKEILWGLAREKLCNG